jgi:hypothetical protein
MMPECYLCDEPAVGVEHVPPKCLFPKAKDLPKGVDLRKNLMTVPSCDAHNSEKSCDDVYFQNVITSCDCINDVGREHYRRQMRRQHKHTTSILARFAQRALSVDNRFAHKVEIERLDNFAEHLGHALYFAHFLNRWPGELGWVPEFLSRLTDPDPATEQTRLELIKLNDLEFRDEPHYGENPKVFSYQVIKIAEHYKMRLHFYEGCKVFFLFTDVPNEI